MTERFWRSLLNIHSLRDITSDQLNDMIFKGISIKASVVQQDEKEEGIRAYLNFGHTLGHAVEAEYGYGQITHGDAVALGMQFALYISEKTVGCEMDRKRLVGWLKSLGYPSQIRKETETSVLLDRMMNDKKTRGGKIQFIVLNELGKVADHTFSRNELESLAEQMAIGGDIMMIRGIRGATTVERDTEEEILQKTKQLLEKIIEENHTKPEDVVQMLLSATP